MANGKGDMSPRLWELFYRLTGALVIACVTAVVVHEVRLTVIESNRFTNQDGVMLKEELLKELPPEWLRDTVKDLKKNDENQYRQLQAIESRLARIEALLSK